MGTMTGERLHRLVDTLPAGELPVVAPEADEPLGGGDRDALDEGRRAPDTGDTVSERELRDEPGL